MALVGVLSRLGARLSRSSDVLLAAGIVSVVAMMIVPLPTALLDLLLTINITVAVVLLLVAIYTGEAIRFSAFDVLRGQEAQHGYIEGSRKAERFFREGKSGGWRAILTPAQHNEIVARHRAVMAAHGYLDVAQSAAS